jgi:hypothetical protein
MAVLLTACAVEVPTPLIPEDYSAEESLEAVTPPPAVTMGDAVAFPSKLAALPASGDKNAFGGITSAPMAAALGGMFAGDIAAVESAVRLIDTAADSTPLEKWWSLFVRVQALVAEGRAAEAEGLIPDLAARETAWIGNDLNSRALQGEVLVWIGDLVSARRVLEATYRRTSAWRLPVSYGGPPTNLGEIVSLTTAQLRAMTALAALSLEEGNAKTAAAWAAAAEARFSDVQYVAEHPLYGPHLPMHYDAYYGRALNLAVLAGAEAQTGASSAASTFDQADRSLLALGWRCGPPLLRAFRARAHLRKGWADDALRATEAAMAAAIANGCARRSACPAWPGAVLSAARAPALPLG